MSGKQYKDQKGGIFKRNDDDGVSAGVVKQIYLAEAKPKIKKMQTANAGKEQCKMLEFTPDSGLCEYNEHKGENPGKTKYRKGSLLLHPDQNPGCPESNTAFQILKRSCEGIQSDDDADADAARAAAEKQEAERARAQSRQAYEKLLAARARAAAGEAPAPETTQSQNIVPKWVWNEPTFEPPFHVGPKNLNTNLSQNEIAKRTQMIAQAKQKL
jgi:hypothetical protein